MRRLNLKDKTFGRLKVLDFAYIKSGKTFWKVKCECGVIKEMAGSKLTYGTSVSCGCFNRESVLKASTTHGGRKFPEYRVWASIKNRCLNPKCKAYPYYGGRGVTMDSNWINSFENFIKDKGRRLSPNHTLDRIDTNGNYTPENTRWITMKEQTRNKRNNIWIDTAYGDMVLTDACMKYDIPRSTVMSRVRRHNLTHQDAFQEIILESGAW